MTNFVTGVTGCVTGYVTGKHRAVIGLLRVLRGIAPARACKCKSIIVSIHHHHVTRTREHARHTRHTRNTPIGMRLSRVTGITCTPSHP